METSSTEKTCPTPDIHQVIIIGAGIAGLSAARHFHKNGITDVLLLEACCKAGGRIQTEKFGDGLIELGAQWIHGEQNEFCQLVKASNHRHNKTSWEGKGDFLCPNGDKVDNVLVDEVLGWIEDNIEEVESTFSIETFQEDRNDALSGNSSMGKYLLDKFNRYLEEGHCERSSPEYQQRMALFQWGMSFQRIDNSCLGMNDVSLYRWSEFEVNPGEHYNNFAKGAQSLVDEILIEGCDNCFHPRVIYNCPVTNINWGPSNVRVSTEDGSTYFGETVLVTLSIGVLKSKLESLFTPNIPERLSSAIQSTGFGPVTKIFLEWAEPWWPRDLKGFQLIWPMEYLDCCEGINEDNLDDIWHKTITGFDPVLDNPNVLLAWLGGIQAIHAETLTNEQIMSRCVQVLKNFTGHDVPQPVKVAVSKWNTNRFFQGAYSFRAVEGDGIKGDICAALCDPIVISDKHGENKPVLVLAGEALSKTHYSTLHGAYESGIAQATKIIQYFHCIQNSASSVSPSLNCVKNSSCEATCSVNKPRKSDDMTKTFAISVSVHAANDVEVHS